MEPPPRSSGSTTKRGPVRSWFTLLCVSFWLVAVVGALGWMAAYSNAPGSPGVPPKKWPAQSRIPFDAQRSTLLLIAHPRCPCTRATMGELELIMARCQGRLNAHVLFVLPEGLKAEWAKSDLWQAASTIPGVTVHLDEVGAEARLFHAQTSGQTLLYGPDGNLNFHGGITIARGHSGDNPGRSAVVAVVKNGDTSAVGTPVFGCSLSNPKCCRTPEKR